MPESGLSLCVTRPTALTRPMRSAPSAQPNLHFSKAKLLSDCLLRTTVAWCGILLEFDTEQVRDKRGGWRPDPVRGSSAGQRVVAQRDRDPGICLAGQGVRQRARVAAAQRVVGPIGEGAGQTCLSYRVA